MRYLLANFTLTLFLVGIVCSAATLARAPKPLTRPVAIEALFSWFLLFSIGIAYTYNAMMKVFFGEMAPAHIGWADSPFQDEVAASVRGGENLTERTRIIPASVTISQAQHSYRANSITELLIMLHARATSGRSSKLKFTALAFVAAIFVSSLLQRAEAAAGELSPPQTPGIEIPAGQIEKAISRLDDLSQTLLKRSGIPGMAVAVVRDGKTVYAKGFGLRKVGEPATIDPDTVFQIASVSKSLSATVVAHQVGQGSIAWDTPIAKHLPWFALADPYVTQQVTIGDMFAHRSGLPDHAGDHLEDLGYVRQQVLERLRLLPLAGFRNTYAYTNFGLTAAAEAVGAASGMDWAALAERTIYAPLGMSSSSSRYADFMARANRAYLHVKVGDAYEARFQRNPDVQSPAGGVSSSINDLARWMTMVMQGGIYADKRIVAAEALLPAITAEMISSPSFAADVRPGLYGFGFNVDVTPSGRIELNHSGAFALGAATAFRILPQAKVGIVVLTNASPIGVPEALTKEFNDLVQFGEVTRDWFAAFSHAMASLTAPSGELIGKTPPANPTPAKNAVAYAGTYANAYYGPVTITNFASGLALRIGPANIEMVLDHWSGNDFTVAPVSENESPGSVSRVTFEVDGATAKSLTIEYLNADDLGTFVRN